MPTPCDGIDTAMLPSTPSPVLLVDDSRDDAALALHALRHAGLAGAVLWLDDGAVAAELLLGPEGEGLRSELRLILLDIKLPKVGGIELLRRLKADPATRRIPIVMLTSSGEDSDVEACYDLGVNGYIVKAVDFSAYSFAVVEAVRYWTSVNTSISAEGEVHRAPET